METKKCGTCKEIKSLVEFNKNKSRKDGYNSQCKICSSKSYKKWAINNKESIKIRKKEYRKNNKEHLTKLRKQSRINGGYEKDKLYYIKNKTIINKKQNERYKKRKSIDPLFKLKTRIRSNISTQLKRRGYLKNSKTQKILGCSYEEFKLYLENQWSSSHNLDENGNIWMSWDNYGNPKDGIFELNKTWDIDHVIPISKATTEQELLTLNHYNNLQPLCTYYNRFIKKDL